MNEQQTAPQDQPQPSQLVDWYVNELATVTLRLARAEAHIVDLRTRNKALEAIAAHAAGPDPESE